MNRSALDAVREVVSTSGMKHPEYMMVTGAELGNGYLASINIICVHEDNRILEFFLKVLLQCAGSKVHHMVCQGFYNECVFYGMLYPSLLKFQLKQGYKTSKLVPICFKVINLADRQVIVLENLAATGYRILNRSAPLPKDHIEMVLRGLGCFHAACFALREKNPCDYRTVADRIRHPFEDYKKHPDFTRLFDFLVQSVIESMNREDAQICAVFERISEEMMPFLVAMGLLKIDKYSIITNTDIWTNNLMFKYDDSSNPTAPTEFCIIDWHMITVAPPVIDVAYFFYSACSKVDMDMLDYYLDLYYSHLSMYMTMLGCSPDDLYPHSVFLEQWKLYSRYGLIMGLLVIRNMLTDRDEREAMKRVLIEHKSMCKAFVLPIKEEETYRRRIRDIIIHMEERGLLDEY